MEELFIKATRVKLTFSTARGNISILDIWDIPLNSNNGFDLENIAQDLYRKTKEEENTISFTRQKKRKTKEESLNSLRFDIVKYIIDIKLEEKEKEQRRIERNKERERLLALIAEKQEDKLKSKSLKKLEEELAKLDEEE